MSWQNILAILTTLLTVTGHCEEDRGLIGDIIGNIFPGSITAKNISYTIYSRDYNGTKLTHTDLDILDPGLPTVILIHGWSKDGNVTFYGEGTEAYLNRQDYNIIAVDYKDAADLFYPTAVSLASTVGELIAQFIAVIHANNSISLDTMEVVGHSLGAQVTGYVGRFVQNLTNSSINRLVGLDPAGPLFWDVIVATETIGAGDADLVVCIHTDVGVYGTTKADCDIDFFPNGGLQPQPGCGLFDVGCSHGRSTELFVESIEDPEGFVSTKCGSWLEFSLGGCKNNTKVTIGGVLTKEESGKYYLETNSQYPYSKTEAQ